ncbi:GAF domain-containing protein [Sphingobacterium olei]|uniref:GAF domain-containing protein n=1 Tax=Sphingobacterium olei TaxID=2571155 RepID=A0A4U0P266_9SPHI|nr:GAF domain-containing protein [Sphingobacterium olei]TJZ60612.1 GAF domain-containing protein [Sphingobacterium olei]
MAEDLNIITGSKVDQYDTLFPQIKALLEGEEDLIANLANIAAALKEQFDFFWVGFYLVKNNQLVLGPFQGPVACTRIRYNKGVCGTAWAQEKSLIVPNVEEFPGHIACNSLSKSEIVIPLYKNKQIIGVLDIDSNQLDDFDHIDEVKLTKILSLI